MSSEPFVAPHSVRHRRDGIVALELAAVLPLLLLLVAGLIETGRLIEVKQVLLTAAREAGRQAAAGRLSVSDIQSVARITWIRAGFPADRLTISVENLTNPAAHPHLATQFDQFRIRLSVPYSDVRLGHFLPLIQNTTLITAEVTWMSLKDKPYPAPPEPDIE